MRESIHIELRRKQSARTNVLVEEGNVLLYASPKPIVILLEMMNGIREAARRE